MGHADRIPSYCATAQNDAAEVTAKDGRTKERSAQVKILLSGADAGRLTSLISTNIDALLWANPAYRYKCLHIIVTHLEPEALTGLVHRDTIHRLDVADTQVYSNRCGIIGSPLCATCGTAEDVEHLLCQCLSSDKERVPLRTCLSIPVGQSLTHSCLIGSRSSKVSQRTAAKHLPAFLDNT